MLMSRRSTWFLSVLSLVTAALAGYWFGRHSWLHAPAARAEERTRMLEECRTKAFQSKHPEEIVELMQAALSYYPSDFRPMNGSHLDGMVVRAQRLAVDDMIRHLTLTTGLDLGDDPQTWIQRFSRTGGGQVPSETDRQLATPESTSRGEGVDGELLRYELAGSYSIYRGRQTVIGTNGAVTVSLTDSRGTRAHRLQLSPDEVSAFEHLIDGVNFFGQPDSDPKHEVRMIHHQAQARLSVTKGGESRVLELEPYHFERLLPLLDQLHRLNHLAEVLDRLETRGDQQSSFAAAEASHSTGPNMVLQPRSLIEALKQVVLDSHRLGSTDYGKLQTALPSLARLQTEAEWIGFISRTLRESPIERQNLLLHVLTSQPFWSQPMPEGRVEALFPVFLSILREPENLRALSSDRSQALSAICHFLNGKQCRAARSTLLYLRENGQDWKLTNSASASWLSLPNSDLNQSGRRIDQWHDPFE